MYRSGQYTVAAIAKTLGVSRASIYRHLSQLGTDRPGRLAGTDHPHRQALAAALGQRRVPRDELLVSHLPLGRWVAAALAGVDDQVAESSSS